MSGQQVEMSYDMHANYGASFGMASGADVPVIATQGVCPHHVRVLCMQVHTSLHRLQTQQGVPKTCESTNGVSIR